MTSQPDNGPASFEEMRPEAHRYSLALRIGVRAAILLLLAAYLVYVAGLLPPAVPLRQLPAYWNLPAEEYTRQVGLPTGWSWTLRLHQGDVAAVLPAAFLASLTAACFFLILPLYVRRREHAYVLIIIAQLIMFVISAIP